MQSRVSKVTGVANALSVHLGRPAQVGEISAQTGLAEGDVRASLELAAAQRVVSISAARGDGSPSPLDSLAEDDDRLAVVEHRNSLSRILGSLEGRERSLLFLRLGVGRTHREAARELGLSPGQASRIFRQALSKARAIAAAIERSPHEETAPETALDSAQRAA
jgi:DNA-directed RNA polymerase specialized sigma subunit